MSKFSADQRKVIAEFLTNIAVAWFGAGVITAFFSRSNKLPELIIPAVWGILFSIGFLKVALFFTKGVKS